MVYLVFLCIFGVVAAESNCPQLKVVDVDFDNFFTKDWYYQEGYDRLWEEGTSCNAISFNTDKSIYKMSAMREGKPVEFQGDYTTENESGILNLASEVYQLFTGQAVISLSFLYVDDDSVLVYNCRKSNDTIEEIFLVATTDPIVSKDQWEKITDKVNSFEFINQCEIKMIDQSKETCQRD